jgi:hypothetical protein
MPRSLTPEEKNVLAVLSDPPEQLQLDQLAQRASMQDERAGLLRAIDSLRIRGFVKFIPLKDNNALVDAANITILPSGLKFVEEAEPPNSASTATSATSRGQTKLRTAIVINILIASPSDVSEERDVATGVIYSWNAAHFESTGIMLNPIRWETHSFPASGDRPQAIINKQIVDRGDLLVGIFGYRLGTPTGEAQSGTIEEIERFRKTGKQVALYFSTAPVPRDVDREQLRALEEYQEERKKDTLYSTFDSPEELRRHLTQHLPKIVSEVHTKLRETGELEGLQEEIQKIESKSEQKLSQITNETTDQVPLADLLSELEDDLACTEAPQLGVAYRRPYNNVWKANRNKFKLPEPLRAELTRVYRKIDSWSDVVESGLNPNLGSMELMQIVVALKSELPTVIKQLSEIIAKNNPPSVWSRL